MPIEYSITANSVDSHQSSPGWCVAFVRYKEPCSAYSPLGNTDPSSGLDVTKDILIVQNDAVSVSTSNSKASFAKTCAVSLKNSNISYQNAVSPGDWMFVWMHEDSNKIQEVVESLKTANTLKPFSSHNDWHSGLKFVGKVIAVSNSDQVSDGGIRQIATQIDGQAFLELASSVYFTPTASLAFKAFGITDPYAIINSNDAAKNRFSEAAEFLTGIMQTKKLETTPDVFIMFIMIFMMGMGKDDFANSVFAGGLKFGNYNDAIKVPDKVTNILGIPSAKFLHHLYRVNLGVQTYKGSGNISTTPWVDFYPIYQGDGRVGSPSALNIKGTTKSVFRFTPDRLKGWVGLRPFNWSNVSHWGAMQEFLNPIVNEMYTALKCDDSGKILPHIIVREMPFSTGLFDTLKLNVQSTVSADKAPAKKDIMYKVKQGDTLNEIAKKYGTTADAIKASNPSRNSTKGKKEGIADINWIYPGQKFIIKKSDIPAAPKPTVSRTMYANLPRWKIENSRLLSISTSTDENKRINFCQVWGDYGNLSFGTGPGKGGFAGADGFKQAQLAMGNFVADYNDIKRAGLRADVVTTNFDYPLPGSILSSPLWARMRADWLFNGHLKLAGSLTTTGIHEPICEGDNLTVRGMVYHIESVTHQCQLSSSGQKRFRTTIGISNGMLGISLTEIGESEIPQYVCHQGDNVDGAGYTGITVDNTTGT
jgi:hypothetical protein